MTPLYLAAAHCTRLPLTFTNTPTISTNNIVCGAVVVMTCTVYNDIVINNNA